MTYLQRASSPITVFIIYPSFLLDTVNLNQATPNSCYPQYDQSALPRSLSHFCGTTFVETAVRTCLAKQDKTGSFILVTVKL